MYFLAPAQVSISYSTLKSKLSCYNIVNVILLKRKSNRATNTRQFLQISYHLCGGLTQINPHHAEEPSMCCNEYGTM